MGVSIWYGIPSERRDKRHDITPDWRSMMHQLFLDNGLYGQLTRDDVPRLLRVGREQRRGEREGPFDYAEDIRKACHTLARAIRRHGWVVVEYAF